MDAPNILGHIRDHRVAFEAPDLLVFDMGVDLTADVAKEFMGIQAKAAEGKKYLLLLCRFHVFKTMSNDARAAMVDPNLHMPPMALAIVGATFRGRVLADFIFRAIRFFGKRDLIVRLFDQEKDARAWLFGTMREELSR